MKSNCDDCKRTIRRVNSPETGTYCTCLDEMKPFLCNTCLAETDKPGKHCTGTAIADHAAARVTAARRSEKLTTVFRKTGDLRPGMCFIDSNRTERTVRSATMRYDGDTLDVVSTANEKVSFGCETLVAVYAINGVPVIY